MNLLLFAGAAEGRILAERMADLPIRATICVATGYGSEMLSGFDKRFTIRAGRMTGEEMRSLMLETACDCVVDATHPYATAASANIRQAAAEAGIPRLRLQRQASPKEECIYVDSAAAAVEALARLEGNVLLTTGAKELAVFTGVPEYAERIYPRVLPTVESVGACAELGFRRSHIIAMQGPFTRELNLAVMRQFAIAVIVTKDGGSEGGFPEKMLAAAEAGVRAVVIGRPPEEKGLSLEEVVAAIQAKAEAER